LGVCTLCVRFTTPDAGEVGVRVRLPADWPFAQPEVEAVNDEAAFQHARARASELRDRWSPGVTLASFLTDLFTPLEYEANILVAERLRANTARP